MSKEMWSSDRVNGILNQFKIESLSMNDERKASLIDELMQCIRAISSENWERGPHISFESGIEELRELNIISAEQRDNVLGALSARKKHVGIADRGTRGLEETTPGITIGLKARLEPDAPDASYDTSIISSGPGAGLDSAAATTSGVEAIIPEVTTDLGKKLKQDHPEAEELLVNLFKARGEKREEAVRALAAVLPNAEDRQAIYEDVFKNSSASVAKSVSTAGGQKLTIDGVDVVAKPNSSGKDLFKVASDLQHDIMIKCPKTGAILILGAPDGKAIDVVCSAGQESKCMFDLAHYKSEALMTKALTPQGYEAVGRSAAVEPFAGSGHTARSLDEGGTTVLGSIRENLSSISAAVSEAEGGSVTAPRRRASWSPGSSDNGQSRT